MIRGDPVVGTGMVAGARVLIVDDEPLVLRAMARLLQPAGFEVRSHDRAEAALEELPAFDPAVIVTDHRMPGMDGVTFLQRARERAPGAVRILCTGEHDFQIAIDAINASQVWRILTKPWQARDLVSTVSQAAEAVQLRRENERLAAEVRRQNAALREMNLHLEDLARQRSQALLEGLIAALDYRDAETQWHSRRVSLYSKRLAVQLRVPAAELQVIEHGALLHDIGKIGVRDHVLLKPGKLTPDEWKEMKRHAELGWALLQRVEHLRPASAIVLQHQERWDGTGYPAGLSGERIGLGARIFHVADTLDAITSDRPYRRARPFAEARDEIVRCSGTQFDPAVVEAFLAIPAEEWERIRVDVETVAVLTADLSDVSPPTAA